MNAIVFAVRGLPAGWLGAYGNEWVATPNLDRLAAESVVFDRHISDEPTRDAANRAWRPLREGVHSVLVRANHPDTDSPQDYYAGWSEVFDARLQDEDKSPLDALIRELPKVLETPAGMNPAARLIWVEIDRLLPPWDVSQEVFEAYIADEGEEIEKIEPLADPEPGPFDKNDPAAWEWLHASFAAVVTAWDAEMGAVFDVLREKGWDKSATWVLTSDYGYPLGEHGIVGPAGSELHEELVHLPLIIRRPDAADAGRRVEEFTQPADLAVLLREPAAQAREHVVSRNESSTVIRTDHWALLVPKDGAPKLFAKPDDRWEVHDVAAMHEDMVQELLKRVNEPEA